MLQKLFSIIIFFAIFIVASIIISIIPISYFGNIISKQLETMSVKVVNSDVWNFRLFGVSAYTSYASFETKLDKYGATAKFYVEDISHKLISGDNYCSKIIANIYIDNPTLIQDAMLDILSVVKDKKYFFKINNLTINIYTKNNVFNNDGADKKNNGRGVNNTHNKDDDKTKTTSNDYSDYQSIFELSFANVILQNKLNEVVYRFNTYINKNENVEVAVRSINGKNNNKTFDVKIDGDDFRCSIHNNYKNGKLTCKIKNLLDVLEDLEIDISNSFYKNLLDKTLSVNLDILYQNNIFILNGSFGLNDDFGTFFYNGDKKSIMLNFDKIDFDKKHLEDVNLDLNVVQTDITKDLSKPFIHNSINDINTLSQLARMVFYFSQLSHFDINVNIGDAVVNGTQAKQMTLLAEKKVNRDKIDVYKFSGSIDGDVFNIEKRQDDSHIFTATGVNFLSFCNFFDINLLKYEGFLKSYLVYGLIDFYTNGVKINNMSVLINDNKVLSYSLDYNYDSLFNKTKTTRIVNISNVNSLSDYVNLNLLYKQYYGKFLEYQSNQQQDATLLKSMFLKSLNDDIVKNAIAIENTGIFDNNIRNLIFTTSEKNNRTEFELVANSDIFTGAVKFNAGNINDYYNVNTDIKASYLNFLNLKDFKNEFELAIKETTRKAFFDDKDYNVPSFFGVNGKIDVDIDNVIFTNDKTCKKLSGKINIGNGIFSSEDLTCKMPNGSSISAISKLSLQRTPEASFGITFNGVKTGLLVKTPINGDVYAQCVFQTRGFNPVNWLKFLDGKCSFVVQSLALQNFDLVSLSKSLVENGVKKDVDYNDIVNGGTLYFQQSNGSIVINDSIAKGDIKFSRELVSGSAEYEYDIFNKNVKSLSGSFAVMGKRTTEEEPFAFYVPFACSGKSVMPKCIIDWKQLEDMIKAV